MSHSNISIFVSHIGCPNQCSFCNQKHITGQSSRPQAADIHHAVDVAKSSNKYNPSSCEIAFFGGSFTAIEEDYMITLLEAAYEHIISGEISGIRISTRPDSIDENILTILKKYRVSAIELGAQSMSDDVLIANKRGHTSADVENASRLIKAFGFELGLQMMTGLYKSNAEKDLETAKQFVELNPDTVRIYPTIVLKNTDLDTLYLEGKYAPLELYEAVKLCEKINSFFITANINVIRIGLHSIDMSAYVAGPWHPSFRELCDAEHYKNSIEKKVCTGKQYNVLVNPSELSKAIGQKRSNICYFNNKNIKINILPDNLVEKREIIVKEVK